MKIINGLYYNDLFPNGQKIKILILHDRRRNMYYPTLMSILSWNREIFSLHFIIYRNYNSTILLIKKRLGWLAYHEHLLVKTISLNSLKNLYHINKHFKTCGAFVFSSWSCTAFGFVSVSVFNEHLKTSTLQS